MKLLFVCAGNIMRSYMAECILSARVARMLGDDARLFESESCGIAADNNRPPHPAALMSLEKLGVDPVDTTAAMADLGHLEWADFALAMTRQQCYKLAGRFPSEALKCYSLVEMNGALEMLLEERSITLDGQDWAGRAKAAGHVSLEAGLLRAVLAIKAIPRESVRQIPGVYMDVRQLMTNFAPCFYQASGIHDPLNGTQKDMDDCARLVDREVTTLVKGMLALALS